MSGFSPLSVIEANSPLDDSRNDSDDALMKRLAGGDGAALDALFLRHRERVFGLAFRYLSNRSEAEDVTQETFLRVLDAAGRYREEGSFKTWLLTITSRLCSKKRARHSVWRERLVGLFHYSMETASDPGKDPDEALLEQEEARRVRDAVQALPPDQRMAIVLARFEGLSYEEISEVMGKSVQSVTSLLWRGRGKLRETLLANRADEEERKSRLSGAKFGGVEGSS